MDGTILNKKYDIVGRIEALEAGGGELPAEVIVENDVAYQFSTNTSYLAGSFVYKDNSLYRFDVDHEAGAWNSEEVTAVRICDSIISEFGDGLHRTGNEVYVKLKSDGGLAFDSNGALYSTASSMTDQNVYNFNYNTPAQIGKVISGQNVYPLYRACFEPPYPMWIQANQEVANFLNPTQVPYPIDYRCIKFYIFDTNNRNITEMAVVERSTGGFMRILKSFNTDTIQIGKFMVEYYVIPAASEEAKSTTSKKKTSK